MAFGVPCPECGSQNEHSGIVDGVLVDDRPCLSCGYSLKGLTTEGKCPECGAEVLRSLRGNLLTYSSRSFVTQLVVGASMVLWGIAIFVGWIVLTVSLRNTSLTSSLAEGVMLFVLAAMPIFASACGFAGWWLLSSPDPALMGQDRATSARKVLRITVCISAAAFVVGVVAQTVGGGGRMWGGFNRSTVSSATSTLAMYAMVFSLFVGLLAWPVKTIASLNYISALALRLPSLRLANRAKSLKRFVIIGAVIIGIAFGIGVFFAAFELGPGPILLLVLLSLCGVLVGTVVWCCFYAALIGSLRAKLAWINRHDSGLPPPD